MAATTGSAAQAKQISVDINDSFQDPDLSAECGVDVFIDFVAHLQVTLVYNKSGLVVRELDHAGNGRITYRSPDTGRSFSFPIQPSQWDYGSGAVIGSTAPSSSSACSGTRPASSTRTRGYSGSLAL